MTHITLKTAATFSLAAMIMFSSISPIFAASKKDAALSHAPGQIKKAENQPTTDQAITMPELPAQASHVVEEKLAKASTVTTTSTILAQTISMTTYNTKKQDTPNQSIHGSNGTVKVGDYTLDNGPDGNPGNKPHLPCKFQIEAYGFDAGVNKVYYVITTQAPTKPKGEVVTSGSFNLDNDDNSFGGSDRGFDGKIGLNLSEVLKKYSAHEKQGYHIKVEVTFDGQPSNSGKHKVFWVEACSTNTTPTPTPTPKENGQTLSTNTSKPQTGVMGTSIERGDLPYTGGIGMALAQGLGLFLIAFGGVVAWGRKIAAQCSY